MNSRELMRRTLRFEHVDRLPRTVWTIPYIWMYKKDDLDRFNARYPEDIGYAAGMHYGTSHYFKGEPNRKGSYIDEFGCEVHSAEDGVCGEVKKWPIHTMDDLDKYKMPWEMLDEADFSGQTEAYKANDKYILSNTLTRPFERMQFLAGTAELYMNIAEETPLFLKLREMVHEFELRDIKMVAAQAVDGVCFMDDWGSQRSLLISPATWRKYFKPMYKEYCDIIHAAGKDVFMHSDGCIELIYEDLIEIGVNAINSQLFCMDMEKIGAQYAGRIAFWGEVDRQHILPWGTEDDVRKAVRRIGNALLKKGHTGLIAQLSWETGTSLQNVLAAFDEFDRI